MTWRITETPPGLTLHARSFLRTNAVRVPVRSPEEIRRSCAGQGIPEAVVDRMAEFQRVWGGIAPSPARCYDGGPQAFEADLPAANASQPCWFEPGLTRSAVPYSFGVGPQGEFMIVMGDKAVALHGSITGWVEAITLERLADTFATSMRRVDGAHAIRRITAPASWTRVDKVDGRADTWLYSSNTVLAVRTAEAKLFEDERLERAYVYRGIPEAYLVSLNRERAGR